MSATITVRISEELRAKIDAVAKEVGVKPSNIVQTLLEGALNPEREKAVRQALLDAKEAREAGKRLVASAGNLLEPAMK